MSDLLGEALQKFNTVNVADPDPLTYADAVVANTDPRLLTRSIRHARRARKAKLAEPDSWRIIGNLNEARAASGNDPAASAELDNAREAYHRQLQGTLDEGTLADDVSQRRRQLSRRDRLLAGAMGFILAGITGLGIGYGVEAQGHSQAAGTAPQQSNGPRHDVLQSAPPPEQAAILGGTALGALVASAAGAYAVGGTAARRTANRRLSDAKQSDS